MQDGRLNPYAVDKLMSEARRIAAEYRRATGKSLGISSEIAKHDACRLLELEPGEEGGGIDALNPATSPEQRIQIKGRVIFDDSKSGQRIGQLKLEQDWDAVVLVLLDENFETTEIYQADRDAVFAALADNDTGQRNRRGAMSVARFKRIGELVWTREDGRLDTTSPVNPVSF